MSKPSRLGPFDAVALEIGAHHPSWGEIHLGPVNAVQAWQQPRAATPDPWWRQVGAATVPAVEVAGGEASLEYLPD